MVNESIEAVFDSLCNKHNLTVLNVGVTHGYHDTNDAWTAYAHWDGDCASGHGPSAGGAISDAIKQANARRAPDAFVDGDILVATTPDLLNAAQKALNYIENTESEWGITFDSGDALRAAIAKAVQS